MALCAKIIISGFVQGVGYRYFALRSAHELSLTGWVKNISHGKVEVYAEGEKEELDEYIAKLKQGPFNSTITDVDVTTFECEVRKFPDFRITH